MATLDAPPAGPGPAPDDGPPLRRVGEADRRAVLALVLTGRVAPRDPAVDAFLDYTVSQGLKIDHCWAAFDPDGRPLHAALAIPSPGRTAMLFAAPVRSATRIPLAQRVIEQTVEDLPAGGVRMVQSLIEMEQTIQRTALERAGFDVLARLIYMHAPAPGRPPHTLPAIAVPGVAVEVLPWSEENRPLFEQAVLGSYEETRDCPGLVGTRHIDDILDGHRGTGVFSPELWHVVTLDEKPAAVLLLAALPPRDALELVYLGVTKAARGHGLGRQLLRLVFAHAAQLNVDRIYLAVDEKNAPALSIYREAGFRSETRRDALVRFLRDE